MRDSSNEHELSGRERQVLHLAAKGVTNKVIARELGITEGTVKLHLHKIYVKLRINGRFALFLWANDLTMAPGE